MNDFWDRNKTLIRIILATFILGSFIYLGLKSAPQLPEKNLVSSKSSELEADSLGKKDGVQQEKVREVIKEIPIKIPTPQEISASELDSYLTGVGSVDCGGQIQKEGSASLWKLEMGYVALTNAHVVDTDGICSLTIGDSPTDIKHSGIYKLDKTNIFRWNSDTDISVLKIIPSPLNADISTPIPGLNYKLSTLKKCPQRMPVGSPVAVIGYPAFSKKVYEYEGHIGTQSFRAVTNGTISAHDTSVTPPLGKLPYPNYFVSAKIDSGSSGGIAFAKDESGLCVLGVPTWLTIGNFETQGLVQNIHNITYVAP